MASTNHFQRVISEVQSAPTDQKHETLIDGIAETMETSGNTPPTQLAQELESVKPQLLNACQSKAA